MPLNPLPDDKILVWSKLKAFADDKINGHKKLIFVLEMIENIVEKGENAGFSKFFSFSYNVTKACISRSSKFGIMW